MERLINLNTLNLALCEGRHEIPQATDGYIFNEIAPELLKNPEKLEKTVFYRIWGKCYDNNFVKVDPNWDECDEVPLLISNVHINLYVTGLTVALISVINAMRDEDVTITLYHYDKDTSSYYSQEVM